MVVRAAPSRSNPDEKTQAIVNAIENYDLADSSAWSDLDALSTHTYIDGVEVDPEGVILENDNKFRGLLNVYLLLQYGSRGEDSFETSESFLGEFKGHFDEKGNPVIDHVSVDTSPFYEGEEETP